MRPSTLMPIMAAAALAVFAASVRAEGTPDAKLPMKNVQLKNPGFEDTDAKKAERPADWQGDGGISSDAHSGKSSLKIGNSQWMRQDFAVAPEDAGKNMTVRLHAKGKGELHFFFHLWKVVDKKNVPTFDGVKGRQDFFALTDEYMPYSFAMKIPEGTDHASVNLGAGHPIMALIDDVAVEIGEPPKAPAARAESAAIPAPAGDTLVNIAACAKIRTDPWGFNVGRMVDGVPWTGLTLAKHPWKKSHAYEFVYDVSHTIAGVRFSLPSGGFAIWADTTGSGKYDTMLAMEADYPPGSYWKAKEWPFYAKAFSPPVKAYAIKLTTFKDSKAVFEFEILSPSKSISPAMTAMQSPAEGVPVLERGAALPQPEPEPDQRYLQGFHVEPWMFDCPGWLKKNPRPPLKDWPAFQKVMADLKRMRCTLVWLFPPKTWEEFKGERKECTYKYDVMWPSQYCRYSHPRPPAQGVLRRIARRGDRGFHPGQGQLVQDHPSCGHSSKAGLLMGLAGDIQGHRRGDGGRGRRRHSPLR